MKTKSIDINALAIEARDGLATGAQDKFTQLYEELNGRKQGFIRSTMAKYPSFRDTDLEALFDDLLWEETRKYDGAIDFMQCLNQALHFRALSAIPKAMGRGIARTPKGVALTVESLDAAIEEKGDAALPFEASEETLFILRQTLRNHQDRLFALSPELTAEQRAAIRYKQETGLSANEIANLAPEIFRNRQQMRRAETKHTPIRRSFV